MMMVTSAPPVRTIYCRNCGYNLAGLEQCRCPECGTAFDPVQPRSYLLRPRRGGWRKLLHAMVALLLLVSVAAGAGISWLYKGYQREEAALVKFDSYWRITREPIGPTWLEKVMPSRFHPWLLRTVSADRQCRRIKDEELAAINELHYLQKLRIYYMWLEDADCPRLGELKDLRTLVLSGNVDLSDEGVKHLLQSPKLRTVQLMGMKKLTNQTVHRLVKLPELEELDLRFTNVTDASLDELTGLASLRQLKVSEDRAVTKEAIARFIARRPDVKLMLR